VSTFRATTAGDAFSPIAAKVRPIWRNIVMPSSFSAHADIGSVRTTESIVMIGNIFVFFRVKLELFMLNLPLILKKLNR
jgi:hypothetical protein